MRITCPYCGARDVGEFTYQGDATLVRPDPASTDQDAWNRYVYERANPAGKHREYWQHSGGCRAHLTVERNTLTHAIGAVTFARWPSAPATGKTQAAAKAKPAAKARAGGNKATRKPATRARSGR